MTNRKKNLYLLGSMLFVVLAIFTLLVFTRLNQQNTQYSSGKITVIGESTCLPHKSGNPSTMECAFGIKSADGKLYGLKNLKNAAELSKHFTVTGTLQAPPANDRYDVAGYIVVQSVTSISK